MFDFFYQTKTSFPCTAAQQVEGYNAINLLFLIYLNYFFL